MVQFMEAAKRAIATGGCFGGLGANPPAAVGWGFGGKAPSRRKHEGLEVEPPALENFAFFWKNNFI